MHKSDRAHERLPEDACMTLESVGDDGEVVFRFAGGHRLRLTVPQELVSHYKPLLERTDRQAPSGG